MLILVQVCGLLYLLVYIDQQPLKVLEDNVAIYSVNRTKKNTVFVSFAPASSKFTNFNELFTCAHPVVHEDTFSLDHRTIQNDVFSFQFSDGVRQALVISLYIGITVDENNLTPLVVKIRTH